MRRGRGAGGHVAYLIALSLWACAAESGSRAAAERVGVGRYQRPPGMPIGTGASGGELDDEAASDEAASPADLTDNSDLDIPKFTAPAAATVAPVPCAGCVELNVDVNDINQRDEFAVAIGGAAVSRVVWTILVNFNSDQLAVQPFIDDERGKYTNLHVNTFPLATPVTVEQEFRGTARTIGLIVGSSGAWTGDQTMSVFVDSVKVEGSVPLEKSFSSGTEGLAPRTHAHHPKVVLHPEK